MANTMTNNQIKIAYLIKKIRYKISKGDYPETSKEQFEKIVWHSLPIVYLDFAVDQSKVTKEIEKRKRIKKRVNKFLREMVELYSQSNFYFVTLTFNEQAISFKASTRHEYVKRYLNETTRCYIANIDYGSQKHREHYHAVVVYREQYERFEYAIEPWKKYGYCKIKFCGIADGDDDSRKGHQHRISSYILKLTNHAGKLTAGKVFHSKMFEDPDELPF